MATFFLALAVIVGRQVLSRWPSPTLVDCLAVVGAGAAGIGAVCGLIVQTGLWLSKWGKTLAFITWTMIVMFCIAGLGFLVGFALRILGVIK